MAKEEWKPRHSAAEYKEQLFLKGQEVADHIIKAHNGLPATSCHRCGVLNATVRDLRELFEIASKIESEKK